MTIPRLDTAIYYMYLGYSEMNCFGIFVLIRKVFVDIILDGKGVHIS